MILNTLVLAASLVGAPTYKLVDTISIGGVARWDYLHVDSASHRLYVSHATQTEVIDTQTNQVIATLPDTEGVHGIAIAADLGLGYTSNGKADTVSVFDLKSFKTVATIKVGANPDAILYDPVHHYVLTFNGHSHDLSVIDAQRGAVIATVPVGGKPEFSQLGAAGNIYFNIENTGEIGVFDPAALKLVQRFALKSCDSPTGLAVDPQQRLYSVCSNHTMVISSPDGKTQARVKIGAGPDGAAWMNGYALSANGEDGTISVVAERQPGQFETVATIPTGFASGTIAADPASRRLYLPGADFAPADVGKDKHKGLPNSFKILVLEAE